MKRELINDKAYIRLMPNSPGTLNRAFKPVTGIDNIGDAHKTEHDCDIVSQHVTYKQVAEGLWYIKSRYKFPYDTELVIDADEEVPYYEMEYFFVQAGKVSLSIDNDVVLNQQMIFSNNSRVHSWHIEKYTVVTSYKFLFTKKFLESNFFINDPVLQESIPGDILNYRIPFYARTIQEVEVGLVKELDAIPGGDNVSFLQTVSTRSCIVQMLKIFFEEQLSDKIRLYGNADMFIGVLSMMQGHINKEFPGLEKLSVIANMSVSSFKRKFNECFDTTPESYFRKLQMDAAEKVLKKPGSNLKDIAHQFGFANAQNFSTAFKKIKGYQPGKSV